MYSQALRIGLPFILLIGGLELKAQESCALSLALPDSLFACINEVQILSVPFSPSDSLSLRWSTGATDSSIVLGNSDTYTLLLETPTCSLRDTTVFTRGDLPILRLDPLPDVLCKGTQTDTLAFNPASASLSGSGLELIDSNQFVFNTIAVDTGTYFFMLLATTSEGCSDTLVDSTSVLLNPSIDIMSQNNCIGDTTRLEVALQDTLSGTATLRVAFGNGVTNEFTDSIPSAVLFQYDSAENFVISAILSNGNGCNAIDTVTHFIFPLPNANFSGLAQEYCQSDPPDTLFAELPGGIFSGQGVTNLGNGQGTFSPQIGGTNIEVRYQITSVEGCVNSTSQRVNRISSIPLPKILGVDNFYCLEGPVDTIRATVSGGSFIDTNGVLSILSGTDSVAIFTPRVTGTFSIGYSVMNEENCRDTALQAIDVRELPIADLGRDTFLGSNSSIVISNIEDNPNNIYEWSNGAIGASLEVANPGFYVLTVRSDITQCFRSDTIEVDFESTIIEFNSEGGYWKIYPNPVTNGRVTLEGKYASMRKLSTIQILDLMGRVVGKQKVLEPFNRRIRIDLTYLLDTLPAGLYFCQLLPSGHLLRIIKH